MHRLWYCTDELWLLSRSILIRSEWWHGGVKLLLLSVRSELWLDPVLSLALWRRVNDRQMEAVKQNMALTTWDEGISAPPRFVSLSLSPTSLWWFFFRLFSLVHTCTHLHLHIHTYSTCWLSAITGGDSSLKLINMRRKQKKGRRKERALCT